MENIGRANRLGLLMLYLDKTGLCLRKCGCRGPLSCDVFVRNRHLQAPLVCDQLCAEVLLLCLQVIRGNRLCLTNTKLGSDVSLSSRTSISVASGVCTGFHR